MPFSEGRPSRLKKPPGIFPAAYMRSSTSTVRGRKSTSRSLPAVAVQSTIVSPIVTTTEPLACFASLPVSKVSSVPAISTEARPVGGGVIQGPFGQPPVGCFFYRAPSGAGCLLSGACRNAINGFPLGSGRVGGNEGALRVTDSSGWDGVVLQGPRLIIRLAREADVAALTAMLREP